MCVTFREEAEKKIKAGSRPEHRTINICDILDSKPKSPHEMSDKIFKVLKKSINTYGLVNPIQVVAVEGKYELLQGYWRVLAHKELGLKTILAGVYPCK